MQVIVLLTAVFAVDAARHLAQPEGALSEDCNKELNRLRDPEVQKAAAECEKKGQYPDKVLALLKKGDEAGATSLTEEMFKKCAKFSDKCASEVAPGLIMELRFSGLAVSDTCAQEAGKVEKDPELQQFAAECQTEEKVGENILMALNKNDLKSAMGVAETSLTKCLKMSEGCAWQLAPVLVNDVVMQAMQSQAAQSGQQQQQQTPQTIVLTASQKKQAVAPQILKLAIQSHQKKAASLLFMAVPKVILPTDQKSLRVSPSLLQTDSHSVWVSKLLLTLARKQL